MNYRIEQLRFLLREDPSSRVFYQLAELLRKEGQLTEAVEILRQGLDRHPRYLAAWVSLGRAQMGLESTVEAEGAFQRALDLDPQNAVAARMMGETAMALKDWPRATKALKLARELAPSDLSLNEKIEFVELQMSGGVESPLDSASRAGRPDQVREEAAIRAPEVISLSAEDPFAMSSASDTGVWRLTQEVFATEEDASGEEAATLPADFLESETLISEAEDEDEVETEPEVDDEYEHEHELGTEPAPEFESEPDRDHEQEPVVEAAEVPDSGAEQEHEPSDALPLPTMTLARLAIEQGDVELAENTLHSLLELDPDHPEAAELLEEIHRDRRGRPAPDIVAAKVATLQEWLDTVRGAAERLNR
jgi:tetratricopeptide (TPR) repeat protein